MPIRFVCPSCRQLLSVGRRKAGSAIACPRCGSGTIVPAASMVGAGGKGDSGAWDQMDGPSGGFEDVNELLGDAPIVQPIIRTAGAAQPVIYDNGYRSAMPGSVSPATMSSAANGQLLLVSRMAIYAQAVLFVLVAIVAFASGYYIGRDQTPAAAPSAAAKANRVTVRGTIDVAESHGKSADEGAVVIALPRPAPLQKFSIRGLRPDDAPDDGAAANIHDAGGDYGRADAKGAYELVVDPGDYLVLIISHHAPLPAGLSQDDLDKLAWYFDAAPDLVGTYQYEILSETLSGSSALLNHTFGEKSDK